MSGSYRKLPSGKWQLRYTDPGGKQVSGGTYPTKDSARRAMARIENEIADGTYEKALAIIGGDFDPKTVTLRQIADHLHQTKVGRSGTGLSPRTTNEYRRIQKTDLAQFMDRPLREITPQQVDRWFAAKRSTGSLRMANAAYKELKRLTDWAVRQGYLNKTPCRTEGATTYKPKPPEPPTDDQVRVMFDNAAGPFRAHFALAAWGGLRKGEIQELRRKDITTFEDGGQTWVEVRISRGVIYDKKTPIVKAPKTRKGIRTATLPQKAGEAVLAHLRTVPINPDALLFAKDEAHTLHWPESRSRGYWERLCDIAGYSGRFHNLRIYAATIYSQAGGTQREAMDRFGHEDHKTAIGYQRSTGRDREIQILRKMDK